MPFGITTLILCLSQYQRSEEFIGEWAEQRGIRDQLVIATKVGAVCLRAAPC